MNIYKLDGTIPNFPIRNLDLTGKTIDTTSKINIWRSKKFEVNFQRNNILPPPPSHTPQINVYEKANR